MQVLKAISIKDKIFPSIEEVHYCVRKKLIQKKELILYKMMIDLNQVYFKNSSEQLQDSLHKLSQDDAKRISEVFIPCSIKFYKNLDQSEITLLVNKMQDINTHICKKIEEKLKVKDTAKEPQKNAL